MKLKYISLLFGATCTVVDRFVPIIFQVRHARVNHARRVRLVQSQELSSYFYFLLLSMQCGISPKINNKNHP